MRTRIPLPRLRVASRGAALGTVLCLTAGGCALVDTGAGSARHDAPTPGEAPDPSPADNATSTTVTLVTGDRVVLVETMGGGRAVTVEPGPGRERMPFTRTRVGHAVTVIPADALPLVREGIVDARLFDVSALIAAGHDDVSRPTLPLIVQALDHEGGTPLGADARAIAPAKSAVAAFWRAVTSPAAGGTRIRLDVAAAPAPTVPAAPTHTLTLDVRDRIGAPAAGGTLSVIDTATATRHTPTRRGDRYVVELPEGRYAVDAMVHTPAGASRSASWTVVTGPDVTVDADTAISLDARAGRPLTVTTDHVGVAVDERGVSLQREVAGVRITDELTLPAPDIDLFAVPSTGAGAHPYPLAVRAFLSTPTTAYNLTFLHDGAIPPDPSFHVRTMDLAAVEVRAPGDATMTRLSAVGDDPGLSGHTRPTPRGGSRVEYFSSDPRVHWTGILERDGGAREQSSAQTYPPRARRAEPWNTGVRAPAITATQCADMLTLRAAPFSSAVAGHFGSADGAPWAGRITLTDAGGRELASSGSPEHATFTGRYPVPGTYGLHLSATRANSAAPTTVDTTWTYRAGEPDCAPLDLPTVRITPPPKDSRASRNAPRPLRFDMESAGRPSTGITAFTVETSNDQGATWKPLPTVEQGPSATVAFLPPGATPSILRTRIHSADGVSQTQSITGLTALLSRPAEPASLDR